jgi:hypothetical protein
MLDAMFLILALRVELPVTANKARFEVKVISTLKLLGQ